MPATMTTPEKHISEVREQLADTAKRIRMVDLAVGGFAIAAAILAYVATTMLLDRVLDLPSWVRQIGWFGMLGGLGVLAYRLIVRPIRAKINPLFAAKKIEETAPDGKNSVINWVDLQDAEMPESVRNAVAQRAAKYLAKADANKAAEHRGLLYFGITAAVLVLLLGVLFLVFKSNAFLWHAKRALNPFASAVNNAMTVIRIETPDGGDTTITEGDLLTITVAVQGREPDANAPDRLRLQIRYSPEGDFTEELPLKSLGDRRWSTIVPEQYIQRGFWYRVAGGDGTTETHRISTRTRPVFTEYELTYDYPDYLNRQSITTRNSPYIDDFPGTRVTVIAKSNRTLKTGQCIVGGKSLPVELRGDTLVATIVIPQTATEYQLKAESNERPIESPKFAITIKEDRAPKVKFKESQSPTTIVASNGLLNIDAVADDDFGIDTMTLKMRIKGGANLQSKPYRGGISFKRTADKTWPKTIDYKDSVRIDELKREDGTPANLKEGQEIEYWIEAIDNCEPGHKGKTDDPPYVAKLTAPVEPEVKKAGEQKRAGEEAKHNKTQDARNATEPRPKENPQKPGEKTGRSIDPTSPEGQKESGDNVPGTKPENDKKVDGAEGAKEQPKPEQGGTNQPNQGNPEQKPSEGGSQQGSKENNDRKTEDDKIKEQAKVVQNELNKQKQAGSAKGSDAAQAGEEQPPSSERKAGEAAPQPEVKPQPGENQPKPSEEKQPGNAENAKPPEGGGEARKPEENGGEGKNQAPPPSAERKGGESSNEPKAENKSGGEPENASKPKGGEGPKDENQQAKGSQPGPGTPGDNQKPVDWDDVEKNARELSHENPGRREAAKQKLEDQLGKDGAKEAENLFRDPPKNAQQMKQKMDELKKNQDELAKKKKDPPPSGGNEAGDIAKAAEGAGSSDPSQQKQANEAMDKMTPEARKKAEQLANDLKSGDPKKQNDAKKEVDELKKKSKETAKENPKPDLNSAKQDVSSNDPNRQNAGKEAISDAAKEAAKREADQLKKDLNSNDPAKRDAAQKKLDSMAGDAAKKEAAELASDLNSNDKEKKAAAEKKLDGLKKKAEKNAASEAGKLDNARNKMQSGDDKTRKDGEDKLAKEMEKNGKNPEDAKKQAADLAKDLNSKDPEKKAAAEKKLDELKKEAAAKAGDPNKVEEAKKDLNANDEKARKEAEKKLADELAKDKKGDGKLDEAAMNAAKKEADQLAKDLQSKNDTTRKAAEKKLDDLKDTVENARKEAAKEKADDIAKKMDSKDDKQRKEAADELARNTPGSDAKAIEDLMKQKDSKDPKISEDAKKKLDDLMAKAMENMKSGPSRAGAGNDPGKPMKLDERFGKQTGDLKLEDFKKEKANAEMLKNLKMNESDYEKFLKGFEEMSKREEAAAKPANPAEAPKVDTINTGGAAKVEARGNAVGNTTGSGNANAPPGFAEARKKMLEATRKGSGSN